MKLLHICSFVCWSTGSDTEPKQDESLIHLYNGRDVFAWFPTGYGKSLCYQLLPFMFDFKLKQTSSRRTEKSVVLVLSPLV